MVEHLLESRDEAILTDAAIVALEAHLHAPLARRQSAPGQSPSERLLRRGASFVTLRNADDDLLGCIGSLEPRRALVTDVVENAVAAATRDPRFRPVRAVDLARGELHISVLSPMTPMRARDREHLTQLLEPKVDGLLIEAGARRGTFLPSVWDQLPDTEEFLDHLWYKAGLRPGTWPDELRICRYTALDLTRRLS